MKYLHHPLIRPESLEERTYQLSIALRALEGDTLVVLPTGLGKTAVALIAAASRLYHNKGSSILMLAPTKPLVEQHFRFFRQFLIPEGDADPDATFALFTGETKIEERKDGWKRAKIIFATPQVVKNDCLAGRCSLTDFSLLIVDECHRAVGNYAYVFIAQHYRETAGNPRVLAMTASPGSDRLKVEEVCANLGIDQVETRSEEDLDVRPYIHEREVQYISVELPEPLQRAVDALNRLVELRLEKLKSLGYTVPKGNTLSMKMLNVLNASIQRRIADRDASAYMAASVYAECMKLRHAISLAETQGSGPLKNYLFKLAREGHSATGTKASKRLASDPVFTGLITETEEWKEEIHPKIDLTLQLVKIQLDAFPESRIIVFATYRDTVQLLVDHLAVNGVEAMRFVGQASKDTEKGLSQKKQLETLRKFREGDFRVLIATSVGEEGLDVPSTDMVVFYEAVPSEIRSIQRKGRTGRHGSGKIVVLVTKGTSDEAFRYVSQSREKAMVSGIRSLSTGANHQDRPTPGRQTSIEAFVRDGPGVVVDDRETSSKVAEHLHRLGAAITLARLEDGDYRIGDRILIERKTSRDFMDTLVERDLLGQLRSLSRAVPRPVLIIEGDDLSAQRNIQPNAIRGTLAAIAVDFGISIFFTRTPEETAEMIYVLARREERDPGERHVHHQKSYRSVREHQEYILSAFPGVGLKHARLLLDHFGSLGQVVEADEEELKKVPGIGDKIAKSICDIARRS
jgi:ERCC4-related helicase